MALDARKICVWLAVTAGVIVALWFVGHLHGRRRTGSRRAKTKEPS